MENTEGGVVNMTKTKELVRIMKLMLVLILQYTDFLESLPKSFDPSPANSQRLGGKTDIVLKDYVHKVEIPLQTIRLKDI